MTRDARPRLRRHRIVVPLFAALLAVFGAVIATEAVRVVGDELERPDLAAFYAQPSPATAGEPGAMIKSEELVGVPFAARAWRLMYHSRDLHDEDVIVTAILVVPLGPAPAEGRTVVSWGHPTTGSAPTCAPSYGLDPFIGIEGMRPLLDRGYAVVATDYAGMGTAGPDSYLVGVTEGNNVLDAVRAARAIPAASASERVILWGHSQGGQAVLFAAEQAGTYAPELQIEAVAAAAPAADLSALMRSHLDDISGVTIGSYAFAAYADVYGDAVPGAQLSTVLTPAAIALLPRMNSLCLLTNIPELHEIGQPLVGNFFAQDPTTTAPWNELLAENSAGGTSFSAPLFIAQGLSDQLVVPADTEEFVRHEQSIGVDVTFEPISFATHATVAYLAIPGLLSWLDRTVSPAP
ncbi:lipase [Microbacterium sp. Root61]|uniref:alpha/beta fold hydrolase n=1 Tax=Microbacterium sp. Root61 TaxID=1736570 RepID=UPI0006F85938|nr:alpha/beta fold hydrolase [Microbacterium sp. Root61]KRA25576.1 lipase [Microbacterium sp. Root61]